MLTHEQTTIRLRDAEILRLKKENEVLTEKLSRARRGLADLIRNLAARMDFYSHRAKMLEMANELEQY